jgi:hypothetical protein
VTVTPKTLEYAFIRGRKKGTNEDKVSPNTKHARTRHEIGKRTPFIATCETSGSHGGKYKDDSLLG